MEYNQNVSSILTAYRVYSELYRVYAKYTEYTQSTLSFFGVPSGTLRML